MGYIHGTGLHKLASFHLGTGAVFSTSKLYDYSVRCLEQSLVYCRITAPFAGTEQVSAAVTLWTCIREVLGSNVGRGHQLPWLGLMYVIFACRQIPSSRMRLKCDGTCAETRFRLSAKRTSPFKSAGASVQSTIGSRGMRISGSNAGYTMFRGSVKSTGYPLHSPVSL
jgi:hypothetical protein